MKPLVALFALLLSTAVQADPLAEFQAIVKKCQTAFNAKAPVDVVFVDSLKQWVKRETSPAKIAYDVRKSESLVSPFTAYIEATEITVSARADDEATAKTLAVRWDGAALSATRRVNFAYQDRAWRRTGGRASSMLRPGPGADFGKPDQFEVPESAMAKEQRTLWQCTAQM